MSPRVAALALVGGGVAAIAVAAGLLAGLALGWVAGLGSALLVAGVAAVLVGLLMVDVDQADPDVGGESRG